MKNKKKYKNIKEIKKYKKDENLGLQPR